MHLITGYITGTVLASYALLVGYVSRDVKRRDMSAALWMLIVVVMPGWIGAVVYFLLRQPIMVRCPNCRTELTAGVHFCPQCRFQVAPVCGQCFRGVQITDAFCPQCGHETLPKITRRRGCARTAIPSGQLWLIVVSCESPCNNLRLTSGCSGG